jgi:hypothetical protein
MHPLIREFVRLWGPETLVAAQTEGLKRRYCGVMVAVAQQIPQSSTQGQIGAVAAAVPHIAEAATTWQDWLAKGEIYLAFVGLGSSMRARDSTASGTLAHSCCLEARENIRRRASRCGHQFQ